MTGHHRRTPLTRGARDREVVCPETKPRWGDGKAKAGEKQSVGAALSNFQKPISAKTGRRLPDSDPARRPRIVPIADSALLSPGSSSSPRVEPGAPHGMCSTLKDQVN